MIFSAEPIQARARGWYVGTTTLDFERSSIGGAVGGRRMLDLIAGRKWQGVDRLPELREVNRAEDLAEERQRAQYAQQVGAAVDI